MSVPKGLPNSFIITCLCANCYSPSTVVQKAVCCLPEVTVQVRPRSMRHSSGASLIMPVVIVGMDSVLPACNMYTLLLPPPNPQLLNA